MNIEIDKLYGPEFLMSNEERPIGEQIGNLISAIGNHEAKALTLLAMKDGAIYNKHELSARIRELQGRNPIWRQSYSLPFDYCAHSLSPIGLVTREILSPNLSAYGYQISEYGRRVGIPFAGLLLDFSDQNNISLERLFASTASSSKKENKEDKRRAPSTTLSIMRKIHILEKNSISLIELLDMFKDVKSHIIVRHIKRLAEIGLLNLEAGNLTASDDQRIIFTDLLERIDRFKIGDREVIEKAQVLADGIVYDSKKFSSLMGRAKENSGHASSSSLVETKKMIFSILFGMSGMSNIQIRQELEKQYDKKLKLHTVEKITSAMVKENMAKVIKEGRHLKYFLD